VPSVQIFLAVPNVYHAVIILFCNGPLLLALSLCIN